MRIRRIAAPLVTFAAALSAGAAASSGFDAPGWAYPQPATTAPSVLDTTTRHHVPNSDRTYTEAQSRDWYNIPDWHPESHPPMPTIVSHGRQPTVYACGYCHLPNGAGRPENATLAGLPASYIEQQVADIKSGARQSAWRQPFTPNANMKRVADSATAGEVAEAARYFSRLRPARRARVIEASTVPRLTPALGLYFADSLGAREPIGHRLVEVPVDAERHELRDAAVPYVAYVPTGSLARGRTIATFGARPGAKSCASCHGPQLRGVGPVPPIAGRSPSYILRQLFAFKAGTRSSAAGAPMREVTAMLDLDDMIAAAAYAASRTP
jgi:cytochrome c553